MSTSFIASSSRSGPFSSTVYHKEFSWKAACKPECIHTGQRRNNPHPSQVGICVRLSLQSNAMLDLSQCIVTFKSSRLP